MKSCFEISEKSKPVVIMSANAFSNTTNVNFMGFVSYLPEQNTYQANMRIRFDKTGDKHTWEGKETGKKEDRERELMRAYEIFRQCPDFDMVEEPMYVRFSETDNMDEIMEKIKISDLFNVSQVH